MCLKPEKVKGRIRNIAKKNQADARTLMRIFMMERFLERIAASESTSCKGAFFFAEKASEQSQIFSQNDSDESWVF